MSLKSMIHCSSHTGKKHIFPFLFLNLSHVFTHTHFCFQANVYESCKPWRGGEDVSYAQLFFCPSRLCNGHNCRLILLRATCSLACVRQVSVEGGRLLACPAKAACSQLIAGTHLGRVSLAAARSLARSLASLPQNITQPLWHGQDCRPSSIIFDLVQ